VCRRASSQTIVSNPAVKTKFEPEREKFDNHGAGGENRTPNLLITNQLLCQLSYTSTSIGGRTLNETYSKI
jgi:hypothetical protein